MVPLFPHLNSNGDNWFHRAPRITQPTRPRVQLSFDHELTLPRFQKVSSVDCRSHWQSSLCKNRNLSRTSTDVYFVLSCLLRVSRITPQRVESPLPRRQKGASTNKQPSAGSSSTESGSVVAVSIRLGKRLLYSGYLASYSSHSAAHGLQSGWPQVSLGQYRTPRPHQFIHSSLTVLYGESSETDASKSRPASRTRLNRSASASFILPTV